MFIAQAFKPQNEFWKYLVGSVIVIFASFVGQLPLLIAFGIKAATDGGAMPANEFEIYNYLDKNLTLFLILLSFAAALLALYITVRALHRQQFK